MTTAQIMQSVWAGLATAAALALLGLWLNTRHRLRDAYTAVTRLTLQKQQAIKVGAQHSVKLTDAIQQYAVLRQEFERKLDRIVELEHELDRVTPLKRT